MTELDDHVITEFRANAGVVLDAMGGHFKTYLRPTTPAGVVGNWTSDSSALRRGR